MTPTIRLFKNGRIWQWDLDRGASPAALLKEEEWGGEAVHGWFLLSREGGIFERVGIGKVRTLPIVHRYLGEG